MPTTSFYDVLGVAEGDDLAAAALWPADRVQGDTGAIGVDPDAVTRDLVRYLQAALRFRAIRPGAAADKVGLSAEVVVENPLAPVIRPLVLTQMPDIAFRLQNTVGVPGTPSYRPARLYATQGTRGTEVVVEGLPVEIQVPSDLLGPSREDGFADAHPEGGPDVTLTEAFQSGVYDSVQVTLRDQAPFFSSIFVHVRVRMTEDGDFIVEPAVPLSIGECRFLGLACHGVHDLGFVPSPRLNDEQPHEQALEWTRHSLNPFARWLEMSKWAGVITARTVDLNAFREPVKLLTDRLNEGRQDNLKVEFVLNNAAFPFFNPLGLPIPLHGEFGLRRPIVAGADPAEAFNLSDPPRFRVGDDHDIVVEQFLLRTPASLDPLDQFVFAKLALVPHGEPIPPSGAMTIAFTDEWVFQIGWRIPDGLKLFTFADATVSLFGVKLGVSLRGMRSLDSQPYDDVQLLVDAGVTVKGNSTFRGMLQVRSLSGKDITVVVRDAGWNLGSLTLGGLAFPEGVEITLFKAVRLIIHDLGWGAEANGASYFSMSGGIALPRGLGTNEPATGSGSATHPDAEDKGTGVLFHRLRVRTGGNPSAPAFLLGGVSVLLRIGRFQLTGLGMVNEFEAANHSYQEFAFALELAFSALGKDFLIGTQLFYGHVKGPEHNFTYWLFGVRLGFFPAGGFELQNVRLLVASNLTPNLPPPDATQQEMRIFRWYKSSGDGAITLPSNRQLGSWRPADESVVGGMGARASTAGATMVTCDLFCLGFGGPEGKGFLAALEVYFAKSAKPIGFAAIEWDLERDKIGILIGITLSIDNVLPEGVDIPLLHDLASITGTLFIGNKPGTVALGQLNDKDTWLSFRFGSTGFIDASVVVGLCIQYVDAPDGPRGFGFMFEAKGGGTFGIGKWQAYFTLFAIVGTWRNESVASGFVLWIEAGIRIKVFWVFNFGASARIEWDRLGPQPEYHRVSLVLKISTPWWLPDATLRVELSDGAPEPSKMRVISPPLVASGALELGRQVDVPAAVTPIVGTAIDDRAVYDTHTLAGLGDPTLADDAFAALTPVGVDSAIALDFKPALDDALTVGENTPPGAGTQAATSPAESDLEVTYELVETSIRRRPRFGQDAGVWTTLLAPEDTSLQTPDDLPPDSELAALFDSAVTFQWDRSRVFQDHLDPRRLLVNAETPYTFVSGDLETDDVIVGSQPGFPCCTADRKDEPWHVLDFEHFPAGTRAPSVQRFTASGSTLHWTRPKAPVVGPGIVAPPSVHVARLLLPGMGPGVFASLAFDHPVFVFELQIYWRGGAGVGGVIVTAFNGLDPVLTSTFPLSAPSPPLPVRLRTLAGFTSVTLRLAGSTGQTLSNAAFALAPSAAAATSTAVPWLEIARMRYRTVNEELRRIAWTEKCKRQRQRALDGGGRLAWLPNHDYEIAVATKVTVAHARSGSQGAIVRQRAGFRTRGLPGLNAVARIGDELEPYVESRYPGPAPRTLYRAEPVMLAFNEKFNVLLPVDRAPSPDNPQEANQILEWVLAVEKLGAAKSERVSQTSTDWIALHRTPLPPRPRGPRVITDLLVKGQIRSATTTDPFRQRLEALVHGPFGCQTPGPSLHRSQILRHEPVDLDAAVDAAQLWEPRNTYRVNVRRKLAPFVERAPFDEGDAPAFLSALENGGPAPQWTTAGGVLRLASPAGDAARCFAVFGDDDWNHLQIRTTVDPEGSAAGVAVAVAGLPAVTSAAIAIVDEVSRTLRLVERHAGSVTELASAPLPEQVTAPYALEVIAFDDKLRATIGETVVEAPRGTLREGRLALVAENGGSFQALRVESLDAYRFEFESSRFESFEAHVGSNGGTVDVLPVDPAASIAALYAETSAEIAAVMAPGGDPLARQALFDRWVKALALPLRRTPTRLHIGRSLRGDDTELLILESPEPLPFTADVRLTVRHEVPVEPPPPPLPDGCLTALFELLTFQRWLGSPPAAEEPPSPEAPVLQWVEAKTRLLTNAAETVALVIPVAPAVDAFAALPPDTYRFELELDRARYRVETPDTVSNYRATATLVLEL